MHLKIVIMEKLYKKNLKKSFQCKLSNDKYLTDNPRSSIMFPMCYYAYNLRRNPFTLRENKWTLKKQKKVLLRFAA